VTFVPIGASSASFWPAVPRATSTAPPTGIGVPAPFPIAITGPTRSVFGVAGGNGDSTAVTAPDCGGVVAP
jgi:hypothetical protein